MNFRSGLLPIALVAPLILAGQTAHAQLAPPPPETPPPPAAKQTPPAPAPLPLDCNKIDEPDSTAPGRAPLIVTVDSASDWRPRGDAVKFTIQGSSFAAADAQVATCFRWRIIPKASDNKPGLWVQSEPPKSIADTNQPGTSYLATVPLTLSAAPGNPLARLLGKPGSAASAALGLVPLADFRVMVRPVGAATWTFVDVEPQPIGITNGLLALVVTIIIVLLGWGALYRFGQLRGVPGAGNAILQVISTKRGYASLSQLQILIWAFVIGGGAVYVMVLSGNLIPITNGALVLLGISGAATLGSQVQSTGTQSAQAPPQAPKAVVGLTVGQVTATDVRLSWATPVGGGVDTYTVSYQPTDAGDNWTIFSTSVEGLSQRVTGLMADTAYNFQVYGSNDTGPGPWQRVTKTTASAPAGIGPVKDLGVSNVSSSSLTLDWTPLAGTPKYRIEYRVHDGEDDWAYVSSGKVVRGLKAYTLYDVRVSAAAPPAPEAAQVFGPTTQLYVSTIGPRKPLWSDLVVQSDGTNEIDVTRVQMLFFTVIVALFVGLRVLVSSEIPDVPPGFIILMGISNGVYLTSKFIAH